MNDLYYGDNLEGLRRHVRDEFPATTGTNVTFKRAARVSRKDAEQLDPGGQS